MISSVEKQCYEAIEVTGGEHTYYRRHSSGEWECLIGMSWEYIDDDALEEEYQRDWA